MNMQGRPRSYREQHHSRRVKFENGRIIIEGGAQLAWSFVEGGREGRSMTSSESDVRFICGLCSQEVSVHDCVYLLDRVFHRVPCGERFVEEMLLEEFESPGTFSRTDLTYIHTLRRTLRRERRTRLFRAVFDFLLGRERRQLERG